MSGPVKSGCYPRGSGGCVLHPETSVKLHGIQAPNAHFNGEEGTCETWLSDKQRMHVKMTTGKLAGQVKSIKPANLRKILAPSKVKAAAVDPSGNYAKGSSAAIVAEHGDDIEPDEELDRILEIFEGFDANGDGILSRPELLKLMASIGLSQTHLSSFLISADKDHDGVVQYREFVQWAFLPPPTVSYTGRNRAEYYWPEPTSEPIDDVGEDHEDADDGEDEYTLAEVEKKCHLDTRNWPENAIKVFNNMHQRFPDFPLQGIVLKMTQNAFHGGKVMAAIRKTRTKEVDLIPLNSVCVGGSGDFPATYMVLKKPIFVYTEGGTSWSFRNLRDDVLPSVGQLNVQDKFTILEVRRGNEYGFCFGRIVWPNEQSTAARGHKRSTTRYWVCLGLEASSTGHWVHTDQQMDVSDLTFHRAKRISANSTTV